MVLHRISLSDDLVFHGIDGDECDRFVAAINQTAFQEKKLRDQAWMADLALAGMRGRALRWYSSLDEDVQLNWRLLHRALLQKYGDHTYVDLTSNPSAIPTPAAAPPLRSADGFPAILSAEKDNFIPRVGPLSLIPIPTAAALLQTPPNSASSVVNSESDERNQSIRLAEEQPRNAGAASKLSNSSTSASSESVINEIPWVLSENECKSYDSIFRDWDTRGTGFISGATALKIFGQSGLSRGDLAHIWDLADSTERGSLNLPEFHVAMGLIYRALNGVSIPAVLPLELIPPKRNLEDSIAFLKDIFHSH